MKKDKAVLNSQLMTALAKFYGIASFYYNYNYTDEEKDFIRSFCGNTENTRKLFDTDEDIIKRFDNASTSWLDEISVEPDITNRMEVEMFCYFVIKETEEIFGCPFDKNN